MEKLAWAGCPLPVAAEAEAEADTYIVLAPVQRLVRSDMIYCALAQRAAIGR